MFKDNYKKDFECIIPSDNVKERILQKINTNEKEKRKIAPVVIWRTATAFVLCIAIALAYFIPTLNKTAPGSEGQKNLKLQSFSDYSSIYKKLSALSRDEFYTYTDDGIVVTYESVDENATAATGGTSATNKGADFGDVSATDVADKAYSETTAQVEGVDEADIVKTDGRYIYSLYENKVRVIKAKDSAPEYIATIPLPFTDAVYSEEMYLSRDVLTVIATDYTKNQGGHTVAVFIDVSNPEKSSQMGICSQSGAYNTSRMIDGKLYLIGNYNVNLRKMIKVNPATYVPVITADGKDEYVLPESICIDGDNFNSAVYLVVGGYDIKKAELVSTQSLLGGVDTLYCSTDSIITAKSDGYNKKLSANSTSISLFTLDSAKITYKNTTQIKGVLLNQFSIDKYKEHFRFVTTVSDYSDAKIEDNEQYFSIVGNTAQWNALYVLDSELNPVGAIENLAEDERVYSVRFMGDTAYFVTFTQTDPLFSVDLSNPQNPVVIGELKIPGFSNYLFPYGDGKLLGIGMDADENTGRTNCMKLSMFDISNPADVTEQDKYLLNDCGFSEALNNHKACLVDYKKNLIGFPAYKTQGLYYCLYSYENHSFKEQICIQLSVDDSNARGLFIDDVFYIVGYKSIRAISLLDMKEIAKIYLTQ